MITINIDEVKLKTMVEEEFKNNLPSILKDSSLEYWVRNEVHKLLAKDVVEKVTKELFNTEAMTKIIKEVAYGYIESKFEVTKE